MSKRVEDMKKFVDHFSSAVNIMMSRDEIDGMALAITNDHPTLQQNKMRLMVACLKKWAEKNDNGFFDLRNEQTCKTAAKMIRACEEGDLYFPTV